MNLDPIAQVIAQRAALIAKADALAAEVRKLKEENQKTQVAFSNLSNLAQLAHDVLSEAGVPSCEGPGTRFVHERIRLLVADNKLLETEVESLKRTHELAKNMIAELRGKIQDHELAKSAVAQLKKDLQLMECWRVAVQGAQTNMVLPPEGDKPLILDQASIDALNRIAEPLPNLGGWKSLIRAIVKGEVVCVMQLEIKEIQDERDKYARALKEKQGAIDRASEVLTFFGVHMMRDTRVRCLSERIEILIEQFRGRMKKIDAEWQALCDDWKRWAMEAPPTSAPLQSRKPRSE